MTPGRPLLDRAGPGRPGFAVTVATSRAYGTFGELLQGVLPDGVDFLVTLPITRWTTARFRLETGAGLRVFPAHKVKAARLAAGLLAEAADPDGPELGGTLVLDSDIPDGKGLASSSADLVATARAVATVLGGPTDPAAVADRLRPIEPTDGVMYGGIVAFEHRRVRLHRALGELPALTVVGVDEGGQVDTVAFNHRPKPFTATERAEYADLLLHLGQSIVDGDLAGVGAVATRSARLNQRLQPKRLLDAALGICAEVGGLGVVAAHSGTMLGILLADHEPEYPARLAAALRAGQDLPDATATVFHTLTFDRTGSDRAL